MLICVDVTELLNVNFVSGIQRVVKEILTRWIKEDVHLRLLNYKFSKQCFEWIDIEQFYAYYTGKETDKNKLYTDKMMQISEFDATMCFFDMDSVWMNFCKRSWLLPKIKEQGTKIAAQIYDIIPVTDAQYCHEFTTLNFMEYIGAHMLYADLIISNANATVDAIKQLALHTEVDLPEFQVVPLGSDFTGGENKEVQVSSVVMNSASKGKYILMVGTLEPRKNHEYILNAFDQKLFQEGWNLIFAGRIGWNIDAFIERINKHPKYQQQLFHLQSASDADIDFLYKHAYAVAFPSFNEGYGLPIIEAFDRNTVVLAADVPILREIGGELCVYFDLADPNSFVEKVHQFQKDKTFYLESKKKLQQFQKYTWDEVAVVMMEAIYDRFKIGC